MKIVSFNVNGIRAIMKKDFEKDLKEMNPDIICLQETKAQDDQVAEALKDIQGYHVFSNSAEKKGYSGTAILSKTAPIRVVADMNVSQHDKEGRVLCAEFEDYYVVTVYVPNSKSGLERLDYRQTWDRDFLSYLKALEKNKPVIVCGDFNVAHKDIDLKNPKSNYNKSAGFTQTEIDGMDNFTKNGFIDTFRYLNDDEVKYSWWSYRGGARDRNVGWRIDYFLVSKKLISQVESASIYNDVFGSDHCPVAIELK